MARRLSEILSHASELSGGLDVRDYVSTKNQSLSKLFPRLQERHRLGPDGTLLPESRIIQVFEDRAGQAEIGDAGSSASWWGIRPGPTCEYFSFTHAHTPTDSTCFVCCVLRPGMCG